MMQALKRLKSRIGNIFRPIIRSEVDKAMSEIMTLLPQLIDFQNSPPERRQSFYERTKDPENDHTTYSVTLRGHLDQLGVRVEDISIDMSDFRKWMNEYPEITYAYRGFSDIPIEKCLEHYLSFTFQGLSSSDTFIDIAASGSPYADLLRRRMGLTAYRLDLSYEKGIHGYDIGADAGDTGLPDGFATSLALHCAYECFMGDADIRFVHEASRILKPGGSFIIVPLYLDKTYFISTSPYCNQDTVVIDPNALKVWRDDAYRAPFSRHYSPQSFVERIYSHIPVGMEGTVYFLRNLPDIRRSFEGQRIYCSFFFQCTKSAA